MSEPVVVAALNTAADAGWIRSLLEEEGIEAHLGDEAFGTLYGGYLGASNASIKVLVRSEDAERAAELVNRHQTESRARQIEEEENLTDAERQEALVHRALRTALVGMLLLPPIFHIYALVLLSRVTNGKELSNAGRKRARLTRIVSWVFILTTVAVFLYLVSRPAAQPERWP